MYIKLVVGGGVELACENSHFSSLLTAGNVLRGGMSATQCQKFHTDDINQCLNNQSGTVIGFQMQICSILHKFLLVDFGKVLCYLQMNFI